MDIEVLIFAAFLGVIPALIARSKGRDFFPWWIYGALFFIIALIHSIVIKSNDQAKLNEGLKRCPYCAEFIKAEAKVCRYCGKNFE